MTAPMTSPQTHPVLWRNGSGTVVAYDPILDCHHVRLDGAPDDAPAVHLDLLTAWRTTGARTTAVPTGEKLVGERVQWDWCTPFVSIAQQVQLVTPNGEGRADV